MVAPIESRLLEEEPDMADLLVGFLSNSLPRLRGEIHRCAQEQQWEEMARALHDLKGASANYGYPLLADMTKLIELYVLRNQCEHAVALLTDMDDMIERIYQGAPEQF